MKNSLIAWGLIFGTVMPALSLGAAPKSLCSKAYNPKAPVKLQIRSVRDTQSTALLRGAVHDLLNMVTGSMTLPASIFMVNGPFSPEYKDGLIKMRFPFYETAVNQKRLKKTPQESLAVPLHELGHQIFESSLHTWYARQPEVLWAFFSRADGIAAGDSLQFIQNTKGLTKYQNQTSEAIQEKFLEYGELATRYNELFADTLAVLSLKNPDAIYNSFHFKQLAGSADPLVRQFQESLQLRRFDRDHPMEDVQASMKNGPHGVFAPARTFIWRKVYLDYHQVRHPEVPLGEVAARLAKSFVRSLQEITRNFEVPPDQLSDRDMNSHLIKTIHEEFR